MPDTTPHECPIVAAARLSSKRKDDEEWEVLDISMSKQPFRNNVHGIRYEQHDNKNLADGAGNRPDDLLIWRATFEHAFIKNIRIKEIETPAEAHPSVDILLEFTHSGSPRGEKDIKPKETKRLQQGSKHRLQQRNDAFLEGDLLQHNNDRILAGEVPSINRQGRGFPLAGVWARDGPLHVRLEIRRVYQGKAKKRSSRSWHWGAAIALLAGRSDYTWPLSKLASDTWMEKSLTQWVEGQYRQWEDFIVIIGGDDGWYELVPKNRADTATLLPIIPTKRGVSEVVGAAQQNFKREEGPRAEPAELREELLDELKSMGSERKELEEKLAELRVREFCLLDRLTELNNQEELV